jgi:type IV secretory pathway VirB4 component
VRWLQKFRGGGIAAAPREKPDLHDYGRNPNHHRVTENRNSKKKQHNSEYSAKYLQQLWKKVRKQGGLCTGITQNVVDLLQNYIATTMLANSEFVALLKQANMDSFRMAEVIGVSEAQLRFVTNTSSGMGLIKCGSVVIPFDNQISMDKDLYKLYNTNIHEKIAEQKKLDNHSINQCCGC